MDNSWIKLYRSSIQNPAFQKPHTWHYFQYCLLKANHTDKSILWNKEEIIIERGCFITGRKEAAKETGLSQQNIRTALLTLHNLGMIEKSTIKSTSKYTYIKVCNYDTYQQQDIQSNHQINQQSTSNQPAINQQLTTNNNDKNDKNDNKRDRICKFIPPNIEDVKKYITENKYQVNPEAFIKYYTESNWVDANGKKVKNWKQKIITWAGRNNKKIVNPGISLTLDSLNKFIGKERFK